MNRTLPSLHEITLTVPLRCVYLRPDGPVWSWYPCTMDCSMGGYIHYVDLWIQQYGQGNFEFSKTILKTFYLENFN